MTLNEQAQERGLLFDDAATSAEHAEVLAQRVASALAKAISANGKATLALSGGRSPEGFLRRLDTKDIDWSRVTVTLVDERWVPEDHADSNAAMVKRCLENAMPKVSWMPLYRGESPEADAARANELFADLMPIDVLVLGMGPDGHTASLFPGMDALEESVSATAPQLCRAVPAEGERRARVTLTGRAIHQAKVLLLQIDGEEKRATLNQAFEASPTDLPIAAFLSPPMEIFYCPKG